MKIQLWAFVRDTRNCPTEITLCGSYDAAQEALAAYCRSNWPKGASIPDDRQQLIQTYFIRAVEDGATLVPCILDVDVPAEALIARALAYEAEAFDSDGDVNGADLVEFFAEWRAEAKAIIGASGVAP